MLLIFNHSTHFSRIISFICLCSERMNSRSFRSVQHFRLNKSFIYILSHFTTKSIHFTDKMTFRRPSYIWITWHQSNTVYTHCKNDCLQTKPGTGKSSFTSCMSRADYAYIYFFSDFSHYLQTPLHLLSHTKFRKNLIDQIFPYFFTNHCTESSIGIH